MSAFLTFLLANLPLIIKFLSLLLGIGGATATHMTASSWAAEGVDMPDLQYFGFGGGSILAGIATLIAGYSLDGPTRQILADHDNACSARKTTQALVEAQLAGQSQVAALMAHAALLPPGNQAQIAASLGAK